MLIRNGARYEHRIGLDYADLKPDGPAAVARVVFACPYFERLAGFIAIAGLAASLAFGPQAQAADEAADGAVPTVSTCVLQPGTARTVARIIDSETVQLDDGSEVRLIGALGPRARDAGAVEAAWPAEVRAIDVLTQLTLGRTVRLGYGGRQRDRYGRHLAHLFVDTADGEIWVQGAMLSAGAARAYSLPGSGVCGSELLAHEAVARRTALGLWASSLYRAKPADRSTLLMSRRGRFEIVEGVVQSVSNIKSGTYLNFGADWRSDFTVRIAKGVLSASPDLAAKVADLVNRRVSVRGWIERRNGPMIDLQDAGQLEVQNEDTPPIAGVSAPGAGDHSRAASPSEARNPLVRPAPDSEKRPELPERKTPGALDL